MTTADRAMCFSLAVLSIAGILVAGYLTSVHYASVPLACNTTGVINCEQVLTSRYSEVLGIPWSVGGVVWFAISGLLGLVALKSPEPDLLQPAQVGWSLLGIVVVAYLIAVELFALKHICIWCTSMHGLVVLTLVLVLFRAPNLDAAADMES